MAVRDSRNNPPTAEKQSPAEGMTHEERLALDHIYNAAFEELKRLAALAKRSRFNPAVSTGTLVNEAWMKLANSRKFAPVSREHFMGVAASAMRQVLTEAARRRSAVKRGGGNLFVTLDPDSLPVTCDKDLLALNAALAELKRLNPRQARIVEERFFGGFEEAEIAAMLDISLSTFSRDWRAAKAWLAVKVRRQG